MKNLNTEHDDEALAAEYVIGVLPRDERRSADARMRRDAVFAGRVERWEARLDGLNKEYGVMSPPARVKTAIDQRLFPETRQGSAIWGWLGGMATALMLALVAVVVWQAVDPAADHLQATLVGDRETITITVSDGQVQLALGSGTAGPPPGSTFELWLVPEDGTPRSLGTFSGDGAFPLAVDLPLGVTLAVSIEPDGGSPTGLPTGPVIAAGALQNV